MSLVALTDVGTQLRRGVLEYCVLALLASGERYGFDLVRALGAVEGMVVSEGTLYPLLTRLRRDGVVETTWRESSSGPPRKYYALTERGREALISFIDEWTRFRDTVDRIVKGELRP
jgi:PadR family transcriptional regulator PadR